MVDWSNIWTNYVTRVWLDEQQPKLSGAILDYFVHYSGISCTSANLWVAYRLARHEPQYRLHVVAAAPLQILLQNLGSTYHKRATYPLSEVAQAQQAHIHALRACSLG